MTVEYRTYIRSNQWRRTRERYWKSGLPTSCYVCDAPRHKGMHLHHRTYKNLGNERLMDLVPLCEWCHEYIHTVFDSDPIWKRRGLWAATKEARKRAMKFTGG